VDFVQEEHGAVIADMSSLQAAGEITWELLWALLSPNELVYHYHKLTEQDQVLRFRRISKYFRESGTPYWSIRCEIVADDGIGFGLAKEPLALEIDEFDGTRRIQDLIVYPLRLHAHAARVRKETLARGRAYAKLDKPTLLRTSGPAMWEERDERWRPHWLKFATHGRAIVDPAALRLAHPNK
jgi:hypothetical protein